MDIKTFISEQEFKSTSETCDEAIGKARTEVRGVSMSAASVSQIATNSLDLDSQPQGPPKQVGFGYVPPPPPLPPDEEKIGRMKQCLLVGFGAVIQAFDEIPRADGWHRKAVQNFVASEKILALEEKLNAQCILVRRGETDADRTEAIEKVEAAMKYYKDLVVWKINGGK
ncbi:MAG: hypothetical protein ACLQBD_08020 [Syntrophobacteraceae bacterium]